MKKLKTTIITVVLTIAAIATLNVVMEYKISNTKISPELAKHWVQAFMTVNAGTRYFCESDIPFLEAAARQLTYGDFRKHAKGKMTGNLNDMFETFKNRMISNIEEGKIPL